jgi:tRNA G46 methylase TrmB
MMHIFITRVKELFSRSLHNQKELAKLFDEYLVPQELEKKQNAEVSTPHHLRKDMLDALEKYVPDFFKTPKRVFETCCGKGQFVVDIKY